MLGVRLAVGGVVVDALVIREFQIAVKLTIVRQVIDNGVILVPEEVGLIRIGQLAVEEHRAVDLVGDLSGDVEDVNVSRNEFAVLVTTVVGITREGVVGADVVRRVDRRIDDDLVRDQVADNLVVEVHAVLSDGQLDLIHIAVGVLDYVVQANLAGVELAVALILAGDDVDVWRRIVGQVLFAQVISPVCDTDDGDRSL